MKIVIKAVGERTTYQEAEDWGRLYLGQWVGKAQ